MQPGARLEGIAEDIARQGYSICADFMSRAEMLAVRAEALQRWEAGDFREAGVGRGGEHAVRTELRSDRVLWVDPASAGPAQAVYLERLEALRQELNQRLFLGLLDFEGHLAVYPPGAFYRKHLDRFRDTDRRLLSTVLYLNEDWLAEDGGALRLYRDPAGEGGDGGVLDVLPLGGTLVTFLSADFWHEVLPARVARMSWTGWFRRRG